MNKPFQTKLKDSMSIKLSILLIILLLQNFYRFTIAENPLPNKIPLIHEHSHYYPTHALNAAFDSPNGVLSPAYGTGAAFVARIYLGQGGVNAKEPQEQCVVVDTGSSLTWVNCPLIVNETTPKPVYNPYKSASHQVLNYTSALCTPTRGVNTFPGESDECRYFQIYKGYFIPGHFSTEDIHFGGVGQRVQGITLGCATNSKLQLPQNGVLGLGAASISLVSQMKATKFSYCIGNLTDIFYQHNFLMIGDGTELYGRKTPLTIEGKYYINLEAIRFGDELLDIEPEIFRRREYRGGMIVDSSATLSALPALAYDKLEKKIKDQIGDSLTRNWTVYYNEGGVSFRRLCYNGVVYDDLEDFPNVKFIFQNKLVVNFTAGSLFQQTLPGTFCLSILPSEKAGLSSVSLLGNVMMQYHYVDIYNWELYMFDQSCSLLL